MEHNFLTVGQVKHVPHHTKRMVGIHGKPIENERDNPIMAVANHAWGGPHAQNQKRTMHPNPNSQCCLFAGVWPGPAISLAPLNLKKAISDPSDQQIGFLSDQQITPPDPAEQPQQIGHIEQIGRPADHVDRADRNAHGSIRSIRSADRTPSDLKQ